MPFTPAHSALVLPFVNLNPRYVSATGLIVGSMAPDFEYFLKMSVDGVHGHTLTGIFYFDLPVGLFLCILFHQVVKKNLIDSLPAFLQHRFRPLSELDFVASLKKNYPAVLVSICIGSASHIFWDGFTHSTGYFVNELPFYRGSYIPFDGVRYPLWYALQHISTFVGLTVIIIYILMIKPQPGAVRRTHWSYWPAVIGVTCLTVFIRFNFEPWDAYIGNLVVSIISGLCIASVFAGILTLRPSGNG